MPTKLNVGASQKIDDNHGSRSASVNLEIELDSNLVMESDKLQERIRELFVLVRQALAEELNGSREMQPSSPPAPSNQPPNGRKSTNGRQFRATRMATPPQIRTLFAIARRQHLNLHDLIRTRCGVDRPEDLSLQQASELIDALTSESDANA